MEYVAEQTGIAVLESAIAEESQDHETDESRWLREIRTRHQSLRWYRRPSVLILCGILILCSLMESMLISPMVVLSLNKICEGIAIENGTFVAGEPPQCDRASVQSVFSTIQSTALIILGIVGTLMSGKLGELSDRFGRIPVFNYMGSIRLLSIILQVYMVLPSTPYHKWGLIAAMSSPALGGNMLALIANGNSYISDIVEPEMRTLGISVLMSSIYGSIGFGPLVGSTAIRLSGGNAFMPFYIAVALGLVFIVLCSTVIVEPRHIDARRKSQAQYLKRRQSIDSARSSVSRGSAKELGKRPLLQLLDLLSPVKKLWLKPTAAGSLIPRYTVLMLLGIDVLFMCATAALMPALALFATFQYHWESVELGYFVSVSGLGRAAVLLLISPLFLHLLKKLYTPLIDSIDKIDIISIRVSLVFVTLAVGAAILGNSSAAMFFCAVLQSLSAFCSPTIQSAVIKYCSKSATGEYFGAMALLRSLVMLVVPPLLLRIYGHTVSLEPKLFLYVPLCCGMLAIGLSWFLRIVEDHELLRRNSQVRLAGGLGERRASTARSLRLPRSV